MLNTEQKLEMQCIENDRLMRVIYERNDTIERLRVVVSNKDELLVEMQRKYDSVVIEKEYIVSEIKRLYKLTQLDNHTLL
jgi:hypothetical protein